VQSILDEPELYDFSMEPVSKWPSKYAIPAPVKGKLRYENENKQLLYEGVMSETQRDTLISMLEKPSYKVAIQHLFEQSQLRPFREMIL
ncbi:MAG: hypothetical protein D3910_15695, partial [Candidatus Electrothrix sp. ATG2]|nr:hypothetical protein [Candidatus Electrothrix sp. ATG2]